ncbi:FAD dependent oxidoreductase [Periconia macrospinosa]|uniref:FAD dependent oxidoreductase n=1 Tax=Periconia macrospinosa TaxID=97972 RepID=A0A2V1DDK7_9PLEO|nr:FAD dependent oxidoreductase [Periconia macrospinosa]
MSPFHIFNQRAMEVLRDAGLEGVLATVASPAHDMQHTLWLNTLPGEEYEKGTYEQASPCAMSDLPQSYLEPVLVEEATKLGAEFRFSTEFLRFEEVENGVVTTLRDRKTEKEFTVSSQYLIGTDGARSAVLQALKIPAIGRQLNNAFNIHIRADLSTYIKHRPGSLNWVPNPDAPDWSAVGNFRMVTPWNEWVVSMHPATKGGKSAQPTEEAILGRLHQMIGDDSVAIEILSSFSWTINDQAMRPIGPPPINGLGSNTCLSDAFNLSWKLAYIVRGWASSSLLDTLTIERKPVGDGIVRPTDLLKADSKEGEEMRTRFREALEATEDEVQALRIQMNQVYRQSGAVLVEGSDTASDFSGLNLLREVMVSTYPGYHLPHVWMAANGQSPRVSTLDLCGQGHFTLLTGIGGDAWIAAAEAVSSQLDGVKVRGFKIGFGCDYMDAYREWNKLRGVGEKGVVLVRPDHFVAWRAYNLVEDAAPRLLSVMQRILHG